VGFAADYSDDQGPMSLSRSPIVAAVVLSGLFLYCLCGAVAGDLVIYSRNGPVTHFHGLAAWLVTLSLVLVCASFSLFARLIEFSSDNTRGATGLALLIPAALFALVSLLLRG
jgi:hypothetical protein